MQRADAAIDRAADADRDRFRAAVRPVAAAWSAVAQPPAATPPTPARSSSARPEGRRAAPDTRYRPAAPGRTRRPAFIVIRPSGKGVLTTTPTNQPTAADADRRSTPPADAADRPASRRRSPSRKDEKDGKLLFDYWFAVAVEGQRIGYVHWAAKERSSGKPFAHGVEVPELHRRRGSAQTVSQWGEESTVETPDGEVLRHLDAAGVGQGPGAGLTGVVEGKTLKVRGERRPRRARATRPWPAGRRRRRSASRSCSRRTKLKAGRVVRLPRRTSRSVNRVVKTTRHVRGGGDASSLWPKTPAAEAAPVRRPKMEPIGKVKLPPATTWVDAETFEPLLGRVRLPGARRPAHVPPHHEGGRDRRRSPSRWSCSTRSRSASTARFREYTARVRSSTRCGRRGTTSRGPCSRPTPGSRSRTSTRRRRRSSCTCRRATARRRAPTPQPGPGKEFTGSNFFINWDNADVKGHAAKAVAGLPADRDGVGQGARRSSGG